MISSIRNIYHNIRTEIRIYQAVLRDPRTPWIAKVLLWIAIGYFFLPFDLIPDWIPILGQIDDIILIPSIIYLALLFIPKQIVLDHRNLLTIG